MRGPNDVYISFGTDLFSYLNLIDDKALNLANNVTINLGKHTLTAGVSFEKMQFANSFTSGAGPAYYRYNSLADFLSKSAPAVFAVAYDPTNPKGIKIPQAKFNQLGIYVQDIWNASEKFKLTYGLRIDQPFYPYTPPQNPALAALVFADENGGAEKFDVSKWPKSRMLFSPRVGFTYDPYGNRKLIIRGGTGLFTGRIPFIWLVNQVGDNGVVRSVYQASTAELASIRYNTDRTTYIPTNPPAVGTATFSNQNYSGVASDFKMPQVWRSNLAIDQKLATDLVLNIEGIFTKMVNNAYFRNANLGVQNGTLGGSADKRPYYNRRLNATADRMAILDNTNKGFSAVFTVGLQKNFSKGWEASVSYTNTIAYDVAIGTSDQSASSWQTNGIYGNPNQPELGYSNFAVPHRFVATASKRFDYWNNKMATTIGIFYSAQSQDRYHFRYGSDINGDGATNDNIYIPRNPSEIQFVEGFKVGSNTYTAAQQSAAFFQFIENNPYLRKRKGQYMERYGATLPWVHLLDLRVLQDFTVKAGNKKHTIQLSADVINFLNLLNSNWGHRYSYTFGSFADMGLLGTPTSGSSSNNTGNEAFNRNNPKYTFNPAGPAKAYQVNYSTSSTWGIQLGLRYIFN
ncbi:MAG: TonB-dependent receptor, partial [Chitinophagaceae bacterium]|nr:TonB-dependent receptor [Chitinophagaceae bacterium]